MIINKPKLYHSDENRWSHKKLPNLQKIDTYKGGF